MVLVHFLRDGIAQWFHGSWVYWLWIIFLCGLIGYGGWYYWLQLNQGLLITHMTNQVSWGLYIANFTFLVGVASAAIMIAIPAYIFDRQDIKDVVIMGDTLAVSAVVMAIMFVVVDLGRPERIWHLIPGLGRFNFPLSMLAWDVVVLNGYLVLNVGISFYLLFSYYRDIEPKLSYYFPFVIITIMWAISIHTVTAFLYSANTGRPFWHSQLLAPRFIASAFASGPALMILGLQIIRSINSYQIRESVIEHLALVMTSALQITLFFVGVELFTEFYNESEHAASTRYLFFGLNGHHELVPWIWAALVMLGIATLIGSIHVSRLTRWSRNLACVLTIAGVWIEKGMGTILPAFIPTPLGEIVTYSPSTAEIAISIGIWGVGLLLFTLLTKTALSIESGVLRYNPTSHIQTP